MVANKWEPRMCGAAVDRFGGCDRRFAIEWWRQSISSTTTIATTSSALIGSPAGTKAASATAAVRTSTAAEVRRGSAGRSASTQTQSRKTATGTVVVARPSHVGQRRMVAGLRERDLDPRGERAGGGEDRVVQVAEPEGRHHRA